MKKFPIIIFSFIFAMFLVSCLNIPQAQVTTLQPTIDLRAETPTVTITRNQPVLAFTKTLAPPTPEIRIQTPTLTPTSIPPPHIPALVSANVFETLSPGDYLIFLDFQEADCQFKAVSRDGKITTLAPCGDFEVVMMPENGTFVSFDQGYVYDLKNQTAAEIKTTDSRCSSRLSSLSWDGHWLAGNCGDINNNEPFRLGIRDLSTDWQVLNLFEKANGDVRDAGSWSSDGNQIAFEYDNNKSIEYPQTGVYTVDVSHCLQDPPHCPSYVKGPFSPSMGDYLLWSPDSDYLAMSTFMGIDVMNLHTKEARTLIDYRSENRVIHGLAWSPDGKWIGYAVDQTQAKSTDVTKSNLYMISLSGGKPILLAENVMPQVLAWMKIPKAH